MKLKIALTLTLFVATFAPLRGVAQTVAGVLPAFITAGTIDPAGKVPVLNGVPGAGVANLSVAFPLTVLEHGASYVYTISLQDYDFSGTIVASYKLTQVQSGKTVTLGSGTFKSFTSAPGNVWAWTANGAAIPNSPGEATLTGTVKYGTKTASTKTIVVLQ